MVSSGIRSSQISARAAMASQLGYPSIFQDRISFLHPTFVLHLRPREADLGFGYERLYDLKVSLHLVLLVRNLVSRGSTCDN